jgi:filamentous hemagglutinin family protein
VAGRATRRIGLAALALVWGSFAAAQSIRIDGNTATAVTALPGGGVGVTIAPPDARGVSLNGYDRFSVEAAGVVFGNEGRGASVIVNEVTAQGAPSLLAGPMAVAGDRADVIVANPAGIVVNGARIANMRALTLVSGRGVAGTGDGRLRFLVGAGAVTVGPQGLDVGDAQRIDLAAGRVVVLGRLGASTGVTLGLHAGQGGLVLSPDALSPDDPHYLLLTDRSLHAASGESVALTLSEGAMLSGGRVVLTADDRGAGVTMAGRTLAGAGEFVVSADGRVELLGARVTARSDLRVTAKTGILMRDTELLAETGALTLTSEGPLAMGDTRAVAQGAVTLAGASIDIGAGAEGAPAIVESSADNLVLRAPGDIAIAGATLASGQGIEAVAGGAFSLRSTAADRVGVLTALDGPLAISAGREVRVDSARLIAAGAMAITAGGSVTVGAETDPATGALRFGAEVGQVRATGLLSMVAGGPVLARGGGIEGASIHITAPGLVAERLAFGRVTTRRSCFLIFCRSRLVSTPVSGGGGIIATDDLRLSLDEGEARVIGGALSGGRITVEGARLVLEPLIYATAYQGAGGLRALFLGNRVRNYLDYEPASLSTAPGMLLLSPGMEVRADTPALFPGSLLDAVPHARIIDSLAALARANRPRLGIFAWLLG